MRITIREDLTQLLKNYAASKRLSPTWVVNNLIEGLQSLPAPTVVEPPVNPVIERRVNPVVEIVEESEVFDDFFN